MKEKRTMAHPTIKRRTIIILFPNGVEKNVFCMSRITQNAVLFYDQIAWLTFSMVGMFVDIYVIT